ncbi:Acetylesterase, partial [Lachnellula suecica]
IGINDISDIAKYTFPYLNITSFPCLYQHIIAAEFRALETVYEAGYRNFLFMNLPPLERTPANIKPGAVPLPNSTMVSTYNALLSTAAQNFSSTHLNTNAMVFDTHTFLSGILDDPSEYGIQNTTGFCARYDAPDIATNYEAYGCLRIGEYFWYNSGHITYRVHELLAGAVGRFLEGASA